MLAMLALQPNAAVSADALIDGLWGDRPPATAPKMIQAYVSQLRRLLAGGDAEIVTRGRGYELQIAADAVDVHRFERLVERGDGREALALWRGAALADIADEPFAAADIGRLDELRLHAVELSLDRELEAGRHAEVVGRLEQLVAQHPLREGLHARRMLALYRSGRQADALAAYRLARQRLVEDVGLEPGEELRDLHDRMLRQDPALLLPRAARPAGPVRAEPPARPQSQPPRPPARRRYVVLAAAALLLGIAVFAVTRLAGSDRPERIGEGAVGLVDPGEAAITAEYGLGRDAGALAAGAGSIWVAHPAQGTVSRVRPGDDRVDVIDVGPAPAGLAFGAGSLWVAGEEDGRLVQVDVQRNRVRQRIRIGNGLRAVAFGFGAVWAAAATDGTVHRVDAEGRVGEPIPVGGHPAALAAGEGGIWVADEEAGTVVHLDPEGRIVGAIGVGNAPSAVAVGAGAVWVANRQDATVSRIDPATDRVTYTRPAGGTPIALAVADGALWIGDAAGAIRRLDPRSQELTATIRTGSAPSGLVAAGDGLWAGGAPSLTAHRGGTLRVESGLTSLDPAVGGFDPGDMPYLNLVYDGLVAHRRAGGAAAAQLLPALAVAIPAPEQDGRRYVFRLRRGLSYSDGTPVRASDFRASIERLAAVSPELAPVYGSIAGVATCVEAPARCDLARGIRTDDRAGTIELLLRRPDPDLMRRLALPMAALVPAATPDEPLDGRPPVGTGPYRVDRIDPERSAVLVRNPRFRARDGRPAGFPDRIEVSTDLEPATVAAPLERGARDLYQPLLLTPDELEALRRRLGARLISRPAAASEFAFLNVHEPPFDDVRVRRAVNLAVDRARLETLAGGREAAAPTCQVLPPGMAGYRPICPFTVRSTDAGAWVAPDTAKARALVAASGTRGTLVEVWTEPDRRAVARHLAGVLEALGFPSRLREFAQGGRLYEVASDPRSRLQVGLIGWAAEHPGPERFVRDIVSCGGGANLSHFCDPALDRAIARAGSGGDQAGQLWARVEREIATRAPIVPLYSLRLPIGTSPRAGNIQSDALTGVLVEQVWVR